MTDMKEKQWIVFKNTEDIADIAQDIGHMFGIRMPTITKKTDDKFLIWDPDNSARSWTNKIEKATLFNQKKAKILASMYSGVPDIHPEIRYGD